MLKDLSGWCVGDRKHRQQEGGQGAADTQLAPTSWDETKNLTVFEILSHDDSADSKNDFFVDDHSISIKTKNQLKS